MNTSIHRSHRLRPAGMTLLELSLVIALLLGLTAIIFIGIGSYRKGSDKAKCKMLLASVQKSVRARANFQNLNIGAAFDSSAAFGPGLALETAPACPSGGTYAWSGTLPLVGTPYGTCDYADTDGVTDHILLPTDTADW